MGLSPRLASAKPTTSPRSFIPFAWTSPERTRGDLRIVARGLHAAAPARGAAGIGVASSAVRPTVPSTTGMPIRALMRRRYSSWVSSIQ